MARKNPLVLTKYKGIYTTETSNGQIQYIARFTHDGTRYPQKNLSKLYGIKTLKQANDKLNEIKSDLSKGIDVFGSSTDKIENLMMDYFSKRSESYRKNRTFTYNKHIKPIIGHLRINKVNKEHIETIISNMQKQELSTSTINKIRVLLNPIFKDAYENETIRRNVLRQVKFPTEQAKPPLSSRLNEPAISAIRKIYNTALKERDDYASMFLLSIMCTRRLGEILQIEYQDITEGWVRVRAGTTKTHKEKHPNEIVENYPLPQEVLERIDFENKKPNEKVFYHYDRTYLDMYKDMIDKRCNLELLPLANQYPIRSHDNRNFIMTIMSKQYGIEIIGNTCLSHSARNSDINQRYNDDIQDDYKLKVFEDYWNTLRGKN